MMSGYMEKELPDWNNSDLCNWLQVNKYRGISVFFQKFNISGYDIFYLNDKILKEEFKLISFHERNLIIKLISKLTSEFLTLKVINSNGDSVILTLDNNQDIELRELSNYIGHMFNIEPKNILYKDSTKQEVLSPTVKIIKMMILYPKNYKLLNVSDMKNYTQPEEEVKDVDIQEASQNIQAQLSNNIPEGNADFGEINNNSKSTMKYEEKSNLINNNNMNDIQMSDMKYLTNKPNEGYYSLRVNNDNMNDSNNYFNLNNNYNNNNNNYIPNNQLNRNNIQTYNKKNNVNDIDDSLGYDIDDVGKALQSSAENEMKFKAKYNIGMMNNESNDN